MSPTRENILFNSALERNRYFVGVLRMKAFCFSPQLNHELCQLQKHVHEGHRLHAHVILLSHVEQVMGD